MKNVTIYSTPTCTYCRAAKEFFKENNIVFTEHNVATDMERRAEMIKKSGQMGVPVIVVSEEGKESEFIVGFDRRRLSDALGIA